MFFIKLIAQTYNKEQHLTTLLVRFGYQAILLDDAVFQHLSNSLAERALMPSLNCCKETTCFQLPTQNSKTQLMEGNISSSFMYTLE